MDFTIILEYTFSEFQDRNISLTVREKNIVTQTLTHTALSAPYNNKLNHNYNKIVKSDWLSTALISALTGQFNRTVRVMPK